MKVKILILEHDPNDLGLLLYELKKSELNYTTEIVQTRESYTSALTVFRPDIILSDFSLPSFDGISAFKIKQNLCPEIPFIIVSGTIGEENAVDLIKQGVTDYALKDRMYQVIPKIQRALTESADRKHKGIAELNLKQREEHLQKIMDLSLDLIFTVDKDGYFATMNPASKLVLNYLPEELIGTRAIDVVQEEDKDRVYKAINTLTEGVDIINFENCFKRKSGEVIHLLWSARWEPNDELGYCVAKDITDIKKAEEKLKNNEKRFRTLLQNSTDGLALLTEDGTIIERSPSAIKILELDENESSGTFRTDLVHPDDLSIISGAFDKVIDNPNLIITEEFRFRGRDGNYKWIEITFHNQLEEPAVKAVVLNFRDITEKKISEIALKKSEASLKEAQAIGGIGNFEDNFIEGISIWSDEMYRMFGIKEEDVVPSFELFISLIHPLDRPTVKAKIEAAIAERQNGKINFRILRPDGEVRYVSHEWHYDFDENGEPIRAFGVQQDITERELREIKIRESEARLKEAQAMGHVGSWEVNLADRSVIWSDEVYRTFGVEPGSVESSSETYISFIHPEDRPGFLAKLEEFYSTLEDASLTFRIIRSDGEVRYIRAEAQFKFNGKGEPVNIFGIQQDVTEVKLAEDAIKKSEEKYRNLFNMSPTPMWLYDVDTLRFLDVNQSAINHYGYDKEEFLSMTLKDIRPEEDVEDLMNTLHSAIPSQIVVTRHIKKNGEVIHVEVQASKMDLGKVKGRMVVATDISERMRYIHAIEEQNIKLREIAWTQSHIVRAPVARIMGLANLPNTCTPDRINNREILSYILDSAYELDGIIRDIVRKTEKVKDDPIFDEQPN